MPLRRRGRGAVLAALLVSGVASSLFLGLVSPTSAGADGAVPSFYLALGGSASVGFQPTSSEPRGEPTSDGYTDDLVAYEGDRGVTLDLTELGCPGETTLTMLYGGGHCFVPDVSQLSEATTFLQSHQGESGIVTIDLGYNDLARCLVHEKVSAPCVDFELASVQYQMSLIVSALKSAAGPNVTFIGIGHYNPFLADELLGHTGQVFALKSSGAIQQLNAVLQKAYASQGMAMANVQSAFERGAVRHDRAAGVSAVGNDVVYACELTWMCQTSPFGPDPHPNDAGYATIAAAIEAQLKTPW